jgi:hypothetical protein
MQSLFAQHKLNKDILCSIRYTSWKPELLIERGGFVPWTESVLGIGTFILDSALHNSSSIQRSSALYFIYPFLYTVRRQKTFGRTTGLGSGALILDPSQVIKLTVLIWTDYFIYWLTHSTNFFRVPAAHEKF